MLKLAALLGGILLAVAGVAAVQLVAPKGGDDASPLTLASATGTTTGATTTGTTTTGRTTTGRTTTTGTTTQRRVDVSGPCDEAEHANDLRCTGGPGADDRSGRGRGRGRGRDDDRADRRGRGGDDGRREDRSGSNSGRR